MSREAVEKIFGRAVVDPRFRKQLESDPTAALASYDLADQEREALVKFDMREFNRSIGHLDPRISMTVKPDG